MQYINHRSIWSLYSIPIILHQHYVQEEEGLDAFCQNIRVYRRKIWWDIKLEKDNFSETIFSWGPIKLTIFKPFYTVHHAKIIRYAKRLEINSRAGRPAKDRWRVTWSWVWDVVGDFIYVRGYADFWMGRD